MTILIIFAFITTAAIGFVAGWFDRGLPQRREAERRFDEAREQFEKRRSRVEKSIEDSRRYP